MGRLSVVLHEPYQGIFLLYFFFLIQEKQIDMLGRQNNLGTLNIEMDFSLPPPFNDLFKKLIYCVTPRKLWKYTHNLKYSACLIRK